MIILHKLYEFALPLEDLVQIYCLFVRSILEFNSTVWFATITEEEKGDLERVQKVACKILLNQRYESYSQALDILKLENLEIRRQKMALSFGKKCANNPKFSEMFPLKRDIGIEVRNREKYQVKFASHSRLMNSSIPEIQRLLNQDARK